MLLPARCLLLLTFCTVLGGWSHAWASAPKDDLEEQQIDYAKQLYGQGVSAMDAKNYDEALRLFGEAYRYAPQLHLFNYNIGQAAELAGNCQRARTAFQMFMDLVPEHPERGAVQVKLDELNRDCPYDAESNEAVSVAARERRDSNRAQAEADRKMQNALDELRKSIVFYRKVQARHPSATVFKRVLAKKQRHQKRLLKLFANYDVPVPDASEHDPPVPEDLSEACTKAAAQEKKNAEAFEEVIEHFEARDVWRVMNRFLRHAERRDRPRFENCS